jgi:hypothetical protein
MSSGLKRPSVIEGLRSAADSGKAAPLPVPAKPAKPVRLNLDIDRELHRWLKGFALQADSDVAHVVRALLAELQADDGLADRVRARVSG